MPIPLLGYIHIVSYFIPAAVAVSRYRDLTPSLRFLAVLTMLACTNIASLFVLGRLGINNFFLINIYVLVEFVLLAVIFLYSTSTPTARRILRGCLIVFPLAWIFDRIYFDTPGEMNTEMALLSRAFLVVLSIFMITLELRDLSVRLVDKGIFWIASAVILYSSGTFIVFGLGNLLLKTDVLQFEMAWHINWSLIILSNLLYSKALLCRS